MNFVDIEFCESCNGCFDIQFENGDIKTTDGFESALLMSVLCEKRASSSEVPAPERRRGWWGNEALDFDDYEIGSKLWLLYQSRKTQRALNDAITYVRDSLQWLIDDDFLDDIRVIAEYGSRDTTEFMNITVDLVKSQNTVLTRGFKIWQNTNGIPKCVTDFAFDRVLTDEEAFVLTDEGAFVLLQ